MPATTKAEFRKELREIQRLAADVARTAADHDRRLSALEEQKAKGERC